MPSESPSISRRRTAEPIAGGPLGRAAFHLDGPTRLLDARVNAFRKDIADIDLAGTLFAPHYAAPMARTATACTMIRTAPSDASEASSQLLPGEEFAVLDLIAGWAWGYSRHDHYVGYVATDRLDLPSEPTHRIAVREALIFAGPSIKAPAIGTLPFGARIDGTIGDGFVETAAGFVHKRHIAPVDSREKDAVSVAELFLGMPYLWGGRGGDGIDCSGLVQIALAAIGIAAPRDTDMQRESVGEKLPEEARLRRGDVVNFPGHVGLMVDESRLIHANAHWMSVVIEPLADVVARLAPNHDRPILSRRRISS
jgi:cell wall-associated NlpC family hydrolase